MHLALYGGLASLKLPACYPSSPPTSSAPSPGQAIPFSSPSHSVQFNPSSWASLEENAAGTTPLSPMTSTQGSSKNIDCPTCDMDCLGRLAQEVPWSHHVNSTIVCRISGKIMDEDNMPLCFPNGCVYSREVRTRYLTYRFV